MKQTNIYTRFRQEIQLYELYKGYKNNTPLVDEKGCYAQWGEIKHELYTNATNILNMLESQPRVVELPQKWRSKKMMCIINHTLTHWKKLKEEGCHHG